MNLWQNFEIDKNTKYCNAGISFHFEKEIEDELRTKYISFAKWLRKNYVFPVHVNIYILNSIKVRLADGRMAYGSIRWFKKRNPLIRIPSAVEHELLKEYTKEEVYEQILSSLVHELTHYYQWVLGEEQSNSTSERQANYFRYRIIDKYIDSTVSSLQK
ncbi:MAG: hypothetical protein IJ386_06565 [Clostridia bacterium]|nr:hypothetical protein [Clostridia bacterium]